MKSKKVEKRRLAKRSYAQSDPSESLKYGRSGYGRIPQELRDRNQWVGVRYMDYGRWIFPVTCNCSADEFIPIESESFDPKQCSSFEIALQAMERLCLDELAFVLSDDDPFVAVIIHNYASAIELSKIVIALLDTYAQQTSFYSDSSGVQLLLKANLMGGTFDDDFIAIFDKGLFFISPGSPFIDGPTVIEKRQEELDFVLEMLRQE